jgi:hypothetical protein
MHCLYSDMRIVNNVHRRDVEDGSVRELVIRINITGVSRGPGRSGEGEGEMSDDNPSEAYEVAGPLPPQAVRKHSGKNHGFRGRCKRDGTKGKPAVACP